MGIHIPQTLLNVSDKVTIKVRLNRITDKQIKNIVRQVQSGYVPMWANSATAHIARYIVNKYNVPCIKWSSWRMRTQSLPTTHPIWEVLPAALAISKLESNDHSEWYKREMGELIEQAQVRTQDVKFSTYLLGDEGKKIVVKAAKEFAVPSDHPVQAFLTKLVNREMEYIEMETGNEPY